VLILIGFEFLRIELRYCAAFKVTGLVITSSCTITSSFLGIDSGRILP